MEGEYDAILPWPFKMKVKFTLIDQQEDPAQRENIARHFIPGDYPYFTRPTSNENRAGHWFPEFISHEKLHSRRYIVDDTLFLQAEFGPSFDKVYTLTLFTAEDTRNVKKKSQTDGMAPMISKELIKKKKPVRECFNFQLPRSGTT